MDKSKKIKIKVNKNPARASKSKRQVKPAISQESLSAAMVAIAQYEQEIQRH